MTRRNGRGPSLMLFALLLCARAGAEEELRVAILSPSSLDRYETETPVIALGGTLSLAGFTRASATLEAGGATTLPAGALPVVIDLATQTWMAAGPLLLQAGTTTVTITLHGESRWLRPITVRDTLVLVYPPSGPVPPETETLRGSVSVAGGTAASGYFREGDTQTVSLGVSRAAGTPVDVYLYLDMPGGVLAYVTGLSPPTVASAPTPLLEGWTSRDLPLTPVLQLPLGAWTSGAYAWHLLFVVQGASPAQSEYLVDHTFSAWRFVAEATDPDPGESGSTGDGGSDGESGTSGTTPDAGDGGGTGDAGATGAAGLSVAAARAAYPVDDGRWWRYAASAETGATWTHRVEAVFVSADAGSTLVRLDHFRSDAADPGAATAYRLHRTTSAGLPWAGYGAAGATAVVFDDPLPFLPAGLEEGGTRSGQTRWLNETGPVVTVEVALLDVDATVETPAGVFEDCLVWRLRHREGAEVIEERVVYAGRGVGTVLEAVTSAAGTVSRRLEAHGGTP